MILVKKALQAVSYIYASSILISGPNTMTLLPNTYSTETLCRNACNNNIACVQYTFWTFNNIPGCYTSTTTSTLTTSGLSSTEPGYIVAFKIPLITITNFDSFALNSLAGISWNNFYTCNSIYTPGGAESASTCGGALPPHMLSRAVDGTYCSFAGLPGGIPSAFSCSTSSNLATACYSGQGYNSQSKTCAFCTGSGFSSGNVQPCTACPANSQCISGRVTSCSAKPYGFYLATDTNVATCSACSGTSWTSISAPCACPAPYDPSNVCSKPGVVTSCVAGFGYLGGSGPYYCADCTKTYFSQFSLGVLPCADCGGTRGICVSPTAPTLLKCYAGYGFNPTDGVSPNSCTVCSSSSPGTFSLGSLPCSSCGVGATCVSIYNSNIASCLPGYILGGQAATSSATCTACSSVSTWTQGGLATSCSPCAVGTAVCDAGTSIVSQCLAKYGYSSTAATSCTPCPAKYYSLGGISACVSCYPLGADCYADTGVAKICPAGYFYTSSKGPAFCTACSTGYSLGGFVTGLNPVVCTPCRTGYDTCDPTSGFVWTCSAGWGGIFDSHGKLVDCSDCSLTPNQFSTGGLLNVCTNCATGTTCNVKTGDFTSCTVPGSVHTSLHGCTPCGSLQYAKTNTDTVCTACPGASSSMACSNINGQTTKCVAGSGILSGPGSGCASCGSSALSTTWSSGSTACQSCPVANTYCNPYNGNSVGCVPGPGGVAGYYGFSNGACSTCLSKYPATSSTTACGCPDAGSCIITQGAQTINSCSAGSGWSTTDCTGCLLFTYSNGLNHMVCSQCPQNGYVSTCSHYDGTPSSCKYPIRMTNGQCPSPGGH